MNKDERYKKIDEIADYLVNLDLLDALREYIHTPMYNKGSNIETYCPFHNDSKLGSFKINPSMNVASCFSCDIKVGNIVSFLMKRYGLSRNNAVLKAAVDLGKISEEERQILSGEKRAPVYKEITFNKNDNFKKRNNIEPLEPECDETLDKVFKYFILGNELIGKKRLTDTHYKYLKDRGLTDEDIIKNEFFSMPDLSILNPLIQRLKKDNLEPEILRRIPGFFKWKKGGNWSFSRVDGIYFPTRNALGQINGIHRRDDTVKEGGSRYKWHSSNFTIYKPELYEIGAKSGTPIDVMYPSTPKETWEPYAIIVEGKFKEIEISKYSNCICLSVQGVGNHKGIQDTLSQIEEVNNIKLKAIFIAFDADIDVNPNIYKAGKSMSELIYSKTGTDIFYYVWDSQFGKGIDDLILASKGHTIKTIHRNIFEGVYGRILPKCLYEEYDEVKKQKITKTNKSLLRELYLQELFNKY